MDLAELEKFHQALDDQFSVPEEERQERIADLEVGKYPGDTPEPFLRAPRKTFDKLTSARTPLVEQVKKARTREQELHPYPKIERTLQNLGLGEHIPSFIAPDVPTPEIPSAKDSLGAYAERVGKPSVPSTPQPQGKQPRFMVEEGEIIDTRGGQIIQPDQFNRLASHEEKAEIERQLKAAGVMEDETPEPTDLLAPHLMPLPGQKAIGPAPAPPTIITPSITPGFEGFERKLQKAVQQQKTGGLLDPLARYPDTESLSLGQAFSHAGKTFMKGIGQTTASGIRAIGIMAKEIDDAFGGEKPLDDYATYQIGKRLSEMAEELFPTRRDLQRNFLLTTVPQAMGSSVPFLLTGMAGTATGGGMFAPAATTGALSGMTGMYEKGLDTNQSQTQRRIGLVVGAMLGSTEALPIGDLLRRINKSTGGGLTEAVKIGTTEAIEEALQEGFQQLGENVFMKYGYNEVRQHLGEGVMEGIGAGGLVGFLTGFLMAGGKARPAKVGDRVDRSAQDLVQAIPGDLAIKQGPPVLRKAPVPSVPPPAVAPMPPVEPVAPVTPEPPAPIPSAMVEPVTAQAPGAELSPVSPPPVEVPAPDAQIEEPVATLPTEPIATPGDVTKPTNERPLAPAVFKGVQPGIPGFMEDFELYNLTADIPGHTKGSTVSRETIEKAGYRLPDRTTPVPGMDTQPNKQEIPVPAPISNDARVTQPRSELPVEDSMDMRLRAEKAQADMEIAGKETGRRKIFGYETSGQGGTPDVTRLQSAAPSWYTELTTGPRPLKRKQIDTAIQKIIQDQGVDVGKAVERVKEALLHDREFSKTPWGEDAESIMRGEWPSWIERPFELEPQKPKQKSAPSQKSGQQEIPVTAPIIGSRPIIGREATPEEAPLFSKAAQTPDTEQVALPSDTDITTTAQYSVRLGNKTYPVESLREASEKFRGAVKAAGTGMSDTPNPLIVDRQTGRDVGYISYNGRIWEGSPGGNNNKLLYDNRNDDVAPIEQQKTKKNKKVKGMVSTPPQPEQKSTQDDSLKELGSPDRTAGTTEATAQAERESDSSDMEKRFNPRRPRIPVAPITGGTVKNLSDIIIDLEKGVSQKLTVGKPPRGAGGVYKPGSTATLIKYSGDLDTTAHELAHALDDRYGLVKEWKGKDSSPFDAELEEFSRHGSTQTTGPKSSPTYARAEGVAEYLRAWIVNPEAAEAAAPTFAKHVKEKLPANIQDALKQFSTHVRQWAGNSAHAKIMANVQWETPETGLTQWLTGGRAAKGPGFQLTAFDQMAKVLTDDLAPWRKALDYAREQRGVNGEPLLPGKDPLLLARLYMGVNAKMDDVFDKGMVNSLNERVTPGGITWLMEPLDRSSVKALDEDMQHVASLMIAERTIEKAEQLGKDRVSGIGAGLESDVAVAQQRLTELREDPERFARLTEAADRYRQWADTNLRYLVEKGRMSEEQYQDIKANNEYYVAMQRILDVSPGEELVVMSPRGTSSRKIGSVGEPVRSFKGSAREIKNPYAMLMDATYQSIREADRNEIMALFRDLLTTDRGMYEDQPMELASVGRQAKEGEKHTISIYLNGKKEIWQFHPEVYKALKGMVEGFYKLPPFITVLPRVLRSTIVNAPPFALRNLIRDAWHRTIMSHVGSKPWDTLKAYTKDEISLLKRAGGDQAGHYYSDPETYARTMKFAMEEAVADQSTVLVNSSKLAHWAKAGGGAYLDLMQQSERQGRLAEYRRAFNHAKDVFGYDDYHASLYAAGQARNLLDYAIAGSWMRVINQMIPFSNAAVQGVRVNLLRARENPTAYAGRFGIYAVLPSLLVYALNYLDDDTMDEYRKFPAYQRDLFWNIKVGPDLWLKIPKPFEIGVLATSVERMLDYSLGNEQAFEGHVGAFLRTMLPVDEASFAGPYQALFQAAANYDFFRDRPIVPRWEENLDLSLRTYNRASRLGQAIQQAVGVDARKIDFFLQQQFGYLGRYAVDVSDMGREDRPGLQMTSSGIFGISPATASLDVKWIADMAERRGLAPSKAKVVQSIKRVEDVRQGNKADALRYGVFRRHMNEYYEAKGSEARDALAKTIRREAQYLRAIWEKTPPKAEAEEKAEKKRAKETPPDPILEMFMP